MAFRGQANASMRMGCVSLPSGEGSRKGYAPNDHIGGAHP